MSPLKNKVCSNKHYYQLLSYTHVYATTPISLGHYILMYCTYAPVLLYPHVLLLHFVSTLLYPHVYGTVPTCLWYSTHMSMVQYLRVYGTVSTYLCYYISCLHYYTHMSMVLYLRVYGTVCTCLWYCMHMSMVLYPQVYGTVPTCLWYCTHMSMHTYPYSHVSSYNTIYRTLSKGVKGFVLSSHKVRFKQISSTEVHLKYTLIELHGKI